MMKRILFGLLLGLFVLYGATASAASKFPGGPALGLWWNPNESGRGFNIDLQGNIMAVTSYVYDAQGKVTWYLSAGIYDFTTATFTATFDQTQNGQCFGCPYRAPIPAPNVGGPMRIVFDSNVTGTLYFNGGSTRLVREIFGFDSPNAFLLGELQMSYNIAGLIGGDWILLKDYFMSDGKQFVGGNLDGCVSCITVGTFDTSQNRWTMLSKVGSYYTLTLYIVDMDDRRVAGRAWIYSTSPTGSGSVAYGSRVLAKQELILLPSLMSQGQAAMRSPTNDAPLIAEREHEMELIAAKQALDASPVPMEAMAAHRQLSQYLAQRSGHN